MDATEPDDLGPSPGGDGPDHPPDRPARPVHRATGASLIVVISVAVTFIGIMVIHAMRSDLDPVNDLMSSYANGSHGAIMSIVFYAFGISIIALGFRLRTAIDRRGVTRAFPLLLGLAGLSLIAAGVFEIDRPGIPQTIEETIHSNAAVAAFAMLVPAMLLFSLACWGDDRWWSVRWASLGLAVTAGAAAVATQFSYGTGFSGAVQRTLAGAVLAWVLLTAIHTRRASFGGHGIVERHVEGGRDRVP